MNSIPAIATAVWMVLVLYYLGPMRSGISLADQVVSALFFISYLILTLAWSLSGPMVTAVCTACMFVTVVYIALALKEPSFLLQALIYPMMYLLTAMFLYHLQKKLNDRRLHKEKLDEDAHLADEERARQEKLERALNRRVDRFLDLHQFAEQLKGIPTLQEVAHRLVEEAHSLLGNAEECVLYLVDLESEGLVPVSSNRLVALEPLHAHGSSFDQWVMKRARPLLIDDSQNDFRFSTISKEECWHLRSVCASPLMTENKVLGVLRASSRTARAFQSEDLHALDIISSLASVALRNRLLYDRMNELAVQDTLTGLYLNRYFQERLVLEVTRADLKKQACFSVILLDIDFFKQYNDEFGHAAGDLVLKGAAKVLQRHLDSTDVGARYGGEEFVILLPGKGMPEAMRMAESIRISIEEEKLILRRVERSLTVSLGVATFPADGRTAEGLMRKADERLYRAKREGRNRVCGSTS